MLFDLKKNIQLLLTGVEINANLLECFGEVNVEQTFENNTQELLEVVYIFPLSSSDSIVRFSINIDGQRTLIGLLKNRHVANQEYKTAVENKQVACYLEKQYNGTYKVQVGNIEPGSKIKVKFTYITFMDVRDGRYMFVLPTNIAPKYQLKSPRDFGHSYHSNQPTYSTDKENFYKLNLNLTWESRGIIEKLESFTHGNSCTFEGTETKKFVSIELSPLQGDFNLAMTTRTEKYPIVYRFQDDTDTYLMLVHKILERDVDQQRDTEYIFLVDRSGSMEGEKMAKTCEALELFLRSLPSEKCYFNIVSFGSDYKYLYPKCLEYNNSNLQKALSDVKTFKADMGGTELDNAINDLLNKKTDKRRCYFLLTDGQVSDSKRIAKNVATFKKPGDRFFAMGVGADAERNLIEEVSAAGHGSHYMVVDTDNLSNTVVQLLDDSSKEYYYDMRFSLLGNDDSERKLEDLSDSVICKRDYLVPNKQFVATFRLPNKDNEQLNGLKLSAVCASFQDTPFTQKISFNSTTDNSFVAQLYGKYLLEKMESKLDYNTSEEEISRVIETSLKYGLLCKYTAFLVVDQQQVVTKELETKEYQIPNYNSNESLSIDDVFYSSRGGCSGGLMQLSMAECCSVPKSMSIMNLSYQDCAACDDEDECEIDECASFSTKSAECASFSTKSASLKSRSAPNLSSITNGLKNAANSFMNMFNNSSSEEEENTKDNLGPISKVMDADVATLTTRVRVKVIEFQNMNGSFDVCKELLQLLNLSEEQLKELADKCSTSNNDIALHIFLVKYFRSRNDLSEKLILKKLTNYVVNVLNGDSKKLDTYVNSI